MTNRRKVQTKVKPKAVGTSSPIVAPRLLFAVGLTAGVIAAIFPRLMTFLAIPASDLTGVLFSMEVWLASGLFALLIGVAMIWLYRGTTQHTRNLFMAALALPAVLSGGVNMTDAVAKGLTDVRKVSRAKVEQVENFVDYAAAASDIRVLNPGNPVNLRRIEPLSEIWMLNLIGIETANAAEAPGTDRRYVVVVASAPTRSEILDKLNKYKNQVGLNDLRVFNTKDTYYLVNGRPKTKADAVLDALKIRSDVGLHAQLLEVN